MRGRQQVGSDRERWVPFIPQHVWGQLRIQPRGRQVVGNGVGVVMQGMWAEKGRGRRYHRRVVRLGQSEGLSLRYDGRGTTRRRGRGGRGRGVDIPTATGSTKPWSIDRSG